VLAACVSLSPSSRLPGFGLFVQYDTFVLQQLQQQQQRNKQQSWITMRYFIIYSHGDIFLKCENEKCFVYGLSSSPTVSMM